MPVLTIPIPYTIVITVDGAQVQLQTHPATVGHPEIREVLQTLITQLDSLQPAQNSTETPTASQSEPPTTETEPTV